MDKNCQKTKKIGKKWLACNFNTQKPSKIEKILRKTSKIELLRGYFQFQKIFKVEGN